MMKIEVINTGTELLLGRVTNTHLAFIGDALFKIGLRVQRQICIPDGEQIRHAIAESLTQSDIIIVTGGLGPTTDDITCEITAELLGLPLKTDQAVLKHIEQIFSSRGLELTAPNLSQALIPEGAEVLHNPKGTAPGIYIPAIKGQSPHIFLLPGPPRELLPLFNEEVTPRLLRISSKNTAPVEQHNFKIIGVGESKLAHALDDDFATLPDLEVGYCCRLGEVDLRLIGDQKNIGKGAAFIRKKFKREIVTESEDSLEQVVIHCLTKNKQCLSTAESCTGGLIASTITDVAGASAIFQQGFITYSNEAKSTLLGIPAQLIEKHGAVSDETVRAMAEGCLLNSKADHALSVSGIAGPGGGSPDKPVGTVHISLASKNKKTFSQQFYFPYERNSFKIRTTRAALDLLRQRLQGFDLS